MPIVSPRICPILIDREADLAALGGLLAEAARGQARLLLLTGEAGAGKSRLSREMAARATALGFHLLTGCCTERDRDFPFAPVVDALRQQQMVAPTGTARLDGWQRELLTDLLPEMRTGEWSSDPNAPSEQTKRRLFEAIGAYIAGLAERQPLLVTLEDLHWADPTSLELLELLPRRLIDRRVLIIGTARSDEPHPDLDHAVVSLRRARAVVEMTLSPLDVAGVGRMLEALMRTTPVPSLVVAVHARSEGNPFVVEELMATASSPGEWLLAEGEATVPAIVQDSVLRRVADIDPVAREVVELAAIIGQRFRFDLLLEASGLPRVELLRALRLLVDRMILIDEESPGSVSFAFRHALTREALRRRLLAPQRRQLHRVIAETLQQGGQADPPASDDARDLGYHFHAAQIWPETLTYATRAGAAAEQIHATLEALIHHRRALDAAMALDDPQAADLHRRCGLALARLGTFPEANAHLEVALAMAQQRGLVAVEQATLYDLAGLHASRDYPAAHRWAERALALARISGDRSQEGLALNRLGNVLTNLRHFDEGRRLHEDALTIFEHEGDRWGSADSLDLIGMTRYLVGEVPEAREAFSRAATVFAALGDRERVASALSSRGLYLAVLDGPCATSAPPVDFEADAAEGLRLCQDIAWRSGEAYALVALACAALGDGRYGEAHQRAVQALDIAEEINHAQWTVIALLTLGLLEVELRNLRRAREHFQRAHDLASAVGAAQWEERLEAWIAYCRVRGGETEIPLLTDLHPDSLPAGPMTIGQRRRLVALAERELARNSPEDALVWVDHLLSGAGPQPAEGVLLRADVLAALGRRDDADAGYLEARRTASEVGPRSVLWRAAAGRAVLWREERPALAAAEAEIARAELTARAATLTDAGRRAAFLEVPEVRRWLASSGRRRTAAAAGPGGLTAREGDVAVLAAQGLSNKEIAHTLGIAEKTVEMHISSCLGKLTFASRAQLAAWVVAQGLLPTPAQG
jgi:DNA-binding CsgD family transcriptional regulator/tetratricopeptide (TPR) repeat protein